MHGMNSGHEPKKEDRAIHAGQYPLRARGRMTRGCKPPCAIALLRPAGTGATLRGQRWGESCGLLTVPLAEAFSVQLQEAIAGIPAGVSGGSGAEFA